MKKRASGCGDKKDACCDDKKDSCCTPSAAEEKTGCCKG
jgi:hypothetical protein